MRRNQSGAAQVSMMWVIFLIVLVLSLSGFTYIAWRDKADKENERLTAIRERDKANTKAEEDRGKVINISEVVGFRDEAVVGSTSDIEAIKEKIDFMMGRFPDHVGSTVNNVEKVIDSIVDACNRMKRELDEKNATLETEIRTRREAQGNLQNIEQQKNMRIQELEGMVNDEQQRAATQKEEDNQRVANYVNRVFETREPHIKRLIEIALGLLNQIPQWRVNYVNRGANVRAPRLVEQAFHQSIQAQVSRDRMELVLLARASTLNDDAMQRLVDYAERLQEEA